MVEEARGGAGVRVKPEDGVGVFEGGLFGRTGGREKRSPRDRRYFYTERTSAGLGTVLGTGPIYQDGRAH